MIDQVRAVVAGDGYRRGLAVALYSMLEHNPSFCRSVLVRCPASEVGATAQALEFLPQVDVAAHDPEFERRLAEVLPTGDWIVERFRALELFGIPRDQLGEADGDVLVLDADTLTTGSLSDLDVEGEVVACGEGARHAGMHVHRATNAIIEPGESTDALTATFNSGVMKVDGAVLGPSLLDDVLGIMASTDWNGVTRRQHDQFVLNRLFEHRWVEAPVRNNFLLRHAALVWSETGTSTNDAMLLHFNLEPRPWAVSSVAEAIDPQVRLASGLWSATEQRFEAQSYAARRSGR